VNGIIEEGALFIADSHYPHHGNDFLLLLQKLVSKEITTPQLFLMGDNFDLLFGYNDYVQTFSKEAVDLLQALSKTTEIHYFEGNHDFCLAALFPHIRVYPRQKQPAVFRMGEKRVALAHGDRYATGFVYHLYATALRNAFMLTLLKPLSRLLIDFWMKRLSRKQICRPFEAFEERAKQILSYYDDAALVIEGHFHQGKCFGKYISLPSLACQKQIATVKNGRIVFTDIHALMMK